MILKESSISWSVLFGLLKLHPAAEVADLAD
jgi:hypothetical protein